jgi:K+-transporting ATPase KdpF subunit
MNATIVIMNTQALSQFQTTGYWIGGLIALFILAYLIFSLIHPEKF